MSILDIVLPHRLFINKSLRKSSSDLRSRIGEYETEYELEIERCSAEIEQVRADKDKNFEKVKLSLLDELSEDADLFEKVRAELLEYTDQVLRRQCLFRIQEVKRLEKQVIIEYRDFLTTQMRLIGEEIELLEMRKDKLVAQAKVDDVKELIRLTGCEIAVKDNDDAISLLAKVNDLIYAYEMSDKLVKQALQKLRAVLQERVDLLPVIQYISWVIQQQKSFSAQLKSDRDKTKDCLQDKANELLEIRGIINALGLSLDEQARTVRRFWAIPITRLNIEINYKYSVKEKLKKDACRKDSEYKTYSENLENIKKKIKNLKGTPNSDYEWDSLMRESKNCKHNKDYAKEERDNLNAEIKGKESEISQLKSERQQWLERRNMLYSLCKKNNIHLIPDGKAELSDECQIIDSRLSELSQIENDTIKREQERFKRESAQIQQARKAKIDELSALIVRAETIQSEKNAILIQASKQLSNSKSHDARFFILKLFSETEEVNRAKKTLQSATTQKKRADAELMTLKATLSKATEDFDCQLEACRPKPYHPTSAEVKERKKLEDRRLELVGTQKQKNPTCKDGRYDSSN